MNQHYQCLECGWQGHEDELRSECTFAGNREEPPEYEAYCPDCGENWDSMIEADVCTSCNNEFQIPESNLCAPCTVDAAEYAMDSR